MKKTYIKPETMVVRINMETFIAQSPTPPVNSGDAADDSYNPGDGSNSLAREVIQAPDAWGEW